MSQTRVTVEFLRKKRACKEQIELFVNLYPDGIEVTPENAREAFLRGLYVPWIFQFFPLTVILDNNKTREWYREGKRHREDGPAVEWSGAKMWYREGQRHREGGPAVERSDGTKMWYREGRLHREGGPAVEYGDGAKAWYREGYCHRVVWSDGGEWSDEIGLIRRFQ